MQTENLRMTARSLLRQIFQDWNITIKKPPGGDINYFIVGTGQNQLSTTLSALEKLMMTQSSHGAVPTNNSPV